MRGLFIVGTDTDVGKTQVTAAIARTLIQAGESIRVSKPIATGAEHRDSELIADDTLILARAVGMDQNLDSLRQITPWTFEPPVAPPVAARLEGQTLQLQEIAHVVQKGGSEDLILVEGVGGLLCPLTESETIADLARLLSLPILVVARRSLGTLNHTLMTLEIAKARSLSIVGLVISETRPPKGLAEKTNIEELTARIDVPILALLPWQESAQKSFSPMRDASFWRRLAESPVEKVNEEWTR